MSVGFNTKTVKLHHLWFGRSSCSLQSELKLYCLLLTAICCTLNARYNNS